MGIEQRDQERLILNEPVDTDPFMQLLFSTDKLELISLISKLPLPIAILDCHSRFIGLNQLFADIYESDAMYLHEKLLSDFSTVVYSQFLEVLQFFNNDPEQDQIDHEFYFKGRFYLFYYKALKNNHTQLTGVIVVCADVTKLKRREKVLLLNNKKLHDHFYLDSITDLPNQAAFEQFIAELSRISDMQLNFTFLKIDLDDFKKFNRLNSYTRGDEVLAQIGSLLNETIPHDNAKIFRLNSASFVVSIENVTEWSVLTLAERLKFAIEQLNLVFNHQNLEKLTASIGIYTLRQDLILSENTLLEQLDLAVREAKSGTKNSIYVLN